MLQRCFYRFHLFLRTSRLPRIRRFRLIIALTLYDPVLPFYLSNIQVRDMESILLLYPLLDLLICSTLLKAGHIHVFEREFNSDILTRYISLGKLDNRLNVARENDLDSHGTWEHIHRADFCRFLGSWDISKILPVHGNISETPVLENISTDTLSLT